MGSFELVTVGGSDNCSQICIKFDPVLPLLLINRLLSSVHNIPDFVFLVTGEVSAVSDPAQVVSGARWGPGSGQGKVTTLCLFVLINNRSELLLQKSGKLSEFELVSCFTSQFEQSRDIRAWETKTNSKRCKLGGKL